MGKVQPTCSNNKEFNLYSMQVSPQKWKLSFWFIFQKKRAPASPRCNQKSMVWITNMFYYFFAGSWKQLYACYWPGQDFFYNLFSVVRAPGFLVRYRMYIGTKLKKKNIYIFFNVTLFQQNHFQKKKFLINGNWKLRCEDPDIQNQTIYSHYLKLPRAEDIACDNCCVFYCLKSIYLLNIFIFLTRRNFRAQKRTPFLFCTCAFGSAR